MPLDSQATSLPTELWRPAIQTKKLLSLQVTPSFGNHLFTYHPVLKHPHTNMIMSSLCMPKVVKSATKFLKIGSQINDLDLGFFYMCKGGNPSLKLRILANLVNLFKDLDLI